MTLSLSLSLSLSSQSVHCAQTICVMSSQMAEAFVRNDIHLILFNILYRDDKTDVSLYLSTPASAAASPLHDVSDSLPTIETRRLSFGEELQDDSEAVQQRDCELVTVPYLLIPGCVYVY